MADAFDTIQPKNLPLAASVNEEDYVIIQSPAGPPEKLPVWKLVGKLLLTGTAKGAYADLAADLEHVDKTIGLIFADPAGDAKNGWYRKVGAPGAGSWARFDTLSKKGDPGGSAMAIGSFDMLPTLSIPGGTDLIQATEFWRGSGRGGMYLAYDASVDADFVAAWPYTSGISANGRGFRLAEVAPSTEQMGVVHDGETDNAAVLQLAMKWFRAFSFGAAMLIWSPGNACVSTTVLPADDLTISAADSTSRITNTATSGPANFKAPFLMGNWHPKHYGYKEDLLAFDAGSVAIVPGDTITGATSGATAVVSALRNQTGSWGAGTAAGTIFVVHLKGMFQDNEAIKVGGANRALANGENYRSPVWIRPWIDRIALAPISGGTTRIEDRQVRCSAAAAATLTVGNVYPLTSNGSTTQADSGEVLEIPNAQSILRLEAIDIDDADQAVLTFEYPLDVPMGATPWLVRVKDGEAGHDQFGLPICIVRGLSIFGLKLDGHASLGSVAAAVYQSKFGGCGGVAEISIQFNALTHSQIENFEGEFLTARAVEVKFGHHDGSITGLRVLNRQTLTSAVGVISVGEKCRRFSLTNFEIIAPKLNAPAFQLQPGQYCHFAHGKVFMPSATQPPILFYGDETRALRFSGIDDVRFVHAASTSILFGGGAEVPTDCYITRCTFETSAVDVEGEGEDEVVVYALVMLSGKNNRITGNRFNKGGILLIEPAYGNIIEGNQSDRDFVGGSFAGYNRVGVNFKAEVDVQLTPFGSSDFGGVRASGMGAWADRAGLTMEWDGNQGIISARTPGAYKPVVLRGEEILLGDGAGNYIVMQAGLFAPVIAGGADLGSTAFPFREAHAIQLFGTYLGSAASPFTRAFINYPEYADDAAAILDGLPNLQPYRRVSDHVLVQLVIP
ncbi:MAG: hypothetical protein EOP62_14265 [Sphingomonadales bacterium]|nr:MAG: hypothetical protein EOP62_14265 [Sphingomonadales bacterium]